MNIQVLFDPKTIAVVGAHNEAGHVGYALMANLLADPRGRQIIPVTEKFAEVFGIPAFPDLSAVPGNIDLVVIAVQSTQVASVLNTCKGKHIPAVIVISAGFREVGAEGKQMEEELQHIAQEGDITLIGPNCLGVINANNGLNATFAACAPAPGGISFVSQSGAIATSLIDWSKTEGVGFAKIVSLGNEALVSEIEILEFLRDDPDTKAILLYLEHVSDGPKFMSLLREITVNKPVVILRAGRSNLGGKAVMSHTGSLAPDDEVFSSATKQAGAITVDTLRDVFSFAKLFHMGITKPFPRIAIVTNGGGPSVNTADLVDLSRSLALVQLDETTKGYLRDVLPSMAAVGDPVDVIGDAGSKRYQDVLDILVRHSEIDAMIVIVTPQMMTDEKAIASVLVSASHNKPIIPAFMGGETHKEACVVLREGGLVNFEFPTDAVAVLDLLARGTKKPGAVFLAPSASSPSLVMLDFESTTRLLMENRIPLSGMFIKNREEIPSVMANMGSVRCALKAISKDVVHKSEAGAVHIGLQGLQDVERAWDEIYARISAQEPSAHIDGMLVQPMARGREIIIGMKRDKTFGPVILFGLGGIFVEILKDVSMRVAPVSREEAIAQIRSIKSAKLLQGARGERPVDEQSLVNIIVALSKLSLEHPEILEIDLNPVMATEEGCVIVDARFMVPK